jgi:hypothetical protein
MLQEKQFYLDQLKDGPVGHRHIMGRMSTRFNISSVVVRDALIRDGLIQVVAKKRIGSSQKFNYMMALVNKDAVVEMQRPQTQVIEDCWPDGTAKSKGNAFDWRNKGQSIFTKAQIAQMQQKQKPNSPMTIYSRA